MDELKSKFALLIHACDRYELLYQGFDYFFNTNWDSTIQCNKYFATEEVTAEVKNFNNIKSGKGEWSDRLKVLLNKMTEQYVIYMQEDMWLGAKVNADLFNDLLKTGSDLNIQQFKLHSSEVYKTIPTDIIIHGLKVSQIDKIESDFLMSHQITIWDRKFLLNQLPAGEHPWRNERKGTKRLRKLEYSIFHIDLFAENGKKSINNNIDESLRSTYSTVSVNGVFSSNVLPFIHILFNTADPKLHAYVDKIKYNFEHVVTHDGKPKPRQEDVFKKIKKLFKRNT